MGSDHHEESKLELDKARLKLDEARLRLDEYLAKLEHDKSEMERAKLRHEGWRETFGATIRLADLALKSLLILNGGAALAMLSFAANYSKHDGPFSPGSIGRAVFVFGAGAWLAVATAVMGYLTQLLFTVGWKRMPNILRVLTIVMGFVSLGTFGWGLYQASMLFN